MSEKMNKKKNSDFKLVFQTECEDNVSRGVYSLAIGLSVIFGLFFSYLIAQIMMKTNVLYTNTQAFLIGGFIFYLVAAFGGSYIMNKSEKPAICFLGFLLMAAGTALILTIVLSAYTQTSIGNAFLITMGITAVMTVAATAFPNVFLSMGKMLGLALFAVILIEIVVSLIFRVQQQVTDYIVILIFTGFIGYDWALAQTRPATITNAIRSAASIYIDVINILIRVLSIIGKRKD